MSRFSSGSPVVVLEPRQEPFVLDKSMAPLVTIAARYPCADGASCRRTVAGNLEALRVLSNDMVVLPQASRGCSPFFRHEVKKAHVHSFRLRVGADDIPLSWDELLGLSHYAARHVASIFRPGKTYPIVPELRPTLLLQLNDRSNPSHVGHRTVSVPLEAALLNQDSVQFCRDDQDLVIPRAGIESVHVSLKNAPPFKPSFGLGLDIAGGAMFSSLSTRWYPFPALVLETGISPDSFFPVDSRGGWFGARARLPVHSSVILSMGASAGAHQCGSATPRSLLGPRLAVELVLPSRRHILRAEVQAAYGNFLVGGDYAAWRPWGGVGFESWF